MDNMIAVGIALLLFHSKVKTLQLYGFVIGIFVIIQIMKGLIYG
jgi:hypothetical protein